jgi:uncharacterized protein YidB (DUF937 family)
MTKALHRRLDRLKDMVDQRRLRRLADELGVSVEEVTRGLALGGQRMRDLRDQGLDEHEIFKRYANDLGVTVDELERECERIIALGWE